MTIAVGLPLSRFYDREERHPNKRYLVQPLVDGRVQTLSWAEVGDQARRAAHWLRRQGLPPGSAIVILSRNCAHWIVADLAIWMAGHVSVPLHPALSAESLAQILEHCEARLLFVGKLEGWPIMRGGVRAGMTTIALPICPYGEFDFNWQDLQAWPPIRDNPSGRANQLATIIYGSGECRGVMHSFGTLAFAATHGSRMFDLGEQDRVLSYLPISHITERIFVEMASIYCGQSVFFSLGLNTFVQDLKRARPTAFFALPRIWARLQRIAQRKTPAETLLGLPLFGQWLARHVVRRLGLNAVRVALSSVAPLPRSVLGWYRRLGIEVMEVYGAPENCGYSHILRRDPQQGGWSGQPCPHVEVRIAADGEVLVRSGATMRGYFKDFPGTAAAMTEDGFLRTGDQGEQDARGHLHLTGYVARPISGLATVRGAET